MNAPPLPPLDAEFALKAALADLPMPRPDMARITALLQEMQRQVAALDANTLAATRSNSLDGAMSHAAHAVIAAEAAALCLLSIGRELGTARTTTQAAEREIRQALGEAMQRTGTLLMPLEHHNVEAAAGAERVEVTTPGALPSQFWRQPEPEPDKARIAAALKLGPVPGARMARGPGNIRITKRRGIGE